jgi:pyruvate-formate lyase-activating enzyme
MQRLPATGKRGVGHKAGILDSHDYDRAFFSLQFALRLLLYRAFSTSQYQAQTVYDLLPIFKQLIESRTLSPKAEIRFSGGEPSVLPEFEELLDMVSAYGPRIRIYTNAVVRSEAVLRALAKKRVELVLGIDAATDDVYKKVKGRNVNRQVWDNVAAYVAIDPDNCWRR